MKKQFSTRIISALLTFIMLVSMFPFATLVAFAEETANGEATAISQEGDDEFVPADNDDIVAHANALANGVNTYFANAQLGDDSSERKQYVVENQNMTMGYNLGMLDDKQVAYIKNKQGGIYIQDTMDVFVKMTENDTLYYSKNYYQNVETNIDMFGYYYYQVTYAEQGFTAPFTENTQNKHTFPLTYKSLGTKHSPKEATIPAFKVVNDTVINLVTDNVVVENVDKTNNNLGSMEVLQIEVKELKEGSDFDPGISIKETAAVDKGSNSQGYDPINVKYNTNANQYLKITIKVDPPQEKVTQSSAAVQLFYRVNESAVSEDRSKSFSVLEDGKYHTYYIYLGNETDYVSTTDTPNYIDYLRIDFNGIDTANTENHQKVYIAEVGVVEGTLNIPDNLFMKRYFATYSDKLNHRIQVLSKDKTTENIEKIGVETKIAVNTVTDIVVKDGTGLHYTLDGIDWNTAEYAGFMIDGVGVFGYVLLQDGNEDHLEVTLEGDNYVIRQTRQPNGVYREYNDGDGSQSASEIVSVVEDNPGVIYPSGVWENRTVGEKVYNRYWSYKGAENNANDFYMNQRIYTDTETDFAEFIKEAEIERNPLTQEDFTIYYDESTLETKVSAEWDGFIGYDAWTGAYWFQIACGGFGDSQFKYPNRHWNVKFEVTNPYDDDRDIYIRSYSENGGCIECAALLDGNYMMLPVPIEVAKNFSEASGERDIYNIDDPTYSYAIFPMSVKGGETTDPVNIVHIEQNWGRFPNKQISSIQFHVPYYHLSTGTTETNCIVPWYNTINITTKSLSTLPDHRPWSAPYWKGDPQHNSTGSFSWLKYTDAEGNYYATEATGTKVGSHGPIYADLDMYYYTDDNKIKVTYNHMEMPQQDENRGYYQMKYEILKDVTIADFTKDFSFINITDNDNTGIFQRIGYLNTNNEYAYAWNNYSREADGTKLAKVDASALTIFPLGNDRPYFSFFDMDDYSSSVNHNANATGRGYANVSFIIQDYSFDLANYDGNPGFAIRNNNNYVSLTLNITEELTLKAGDVITINAIVMPWGSQEMESDEEFWENDGDDSTVDWDYDDIINAQTGEKYLDKNVRDVRENIKADIRYSVTSDTDTVVEHPFLAIVRSDNGNDSSFTLRGGENHMAVRVDGFNMLTVPKIQEYVNGNWVEYDVSSIGTPDAYGYGYAFDGYSVSIDEDGKYSYSFIVDMTDANNKSDNGARTFRVSADTEFTGWETVKLEQPVGPVELIKEADDIYDSLINSAMGVGKYNKFDENEDGVTDYVRIFSKGSYEVDGETNHVGESAFTIKNSGSPVETGRYLFFKYRIPTTNTYSNNMQVYIDTDNGSAADTDDIWFGIEQDGEWHIIVIDCSKCGNDTFAPRILNNREAYYALYARIDFFNGKQHTADDYADFAYVGMSDSLRKIADYTGEYNLTLFENFKSNGSTAITVDINTSDFNAVYDPQSIKEAINTSDTETLANDSNAGNMPYVSFYNDMKANEKYNNIVDYTVRNNDNIITNYPYIRSGSYVGILYRMHDDPNNKDLKNSMQIWLGSDYSESNYVMKSCTKGGWQFALFDMNNGDDPSDYNDDIGVVKLRIDYLDGGCKGEITLDFGFIGLFDSEEAAYDYYGKYVSKYNLNHTCIYGEWTLHGVGENEDYRSCMVCGNVETRTAVHESNDVWSHGEEYDFKHCILCGNVSEQRPAEHTASGEWIYGETTDIQNCTECNGVAVSRSHTHSYNDDPWHHIQGEALEERTCVTCNATETRYTKAFGWISLTDYSTYTDGDGKTQTYNVRSSLNSATADASSLKLNFSEENGYYLTLNGEWVAVNGGIYNYVYKINNGEWKNFGYVHYDSTKEYSWGKAYIDAIGQNLGNDAASSAKGGMVSVNNKPKRIELGDVSGDGICITIAIVPYDNQSAIVPIFTFTNIQGPEYFTEGLIFEKNAAGDGYTVTGYEGSATEIVIPSVYRGLPVNKIAEGAITREMLEAGLTVNCEGYTYENGLLIETSTGTLIAGCGSTVEIPETVKTIGTKAFYGCTELTSLYIPSSVMSIGENAFAGCVTLARIEYASSSKSWENLSANAGITSDPEYIFALSVIGDLNGDGKITSYEVLECARYLASIDPATGETSKTIDINADINSDGKINILDLILIRQQVVAE